MGQQGTQRLADVGRPIPVMRAATKTERLRDLMERIARGVAEQPLVRMTDLIGLTDIAGMAKTFQQDDGVKYGAMSDGPGPLKAAIRSGIKAYHGSPHDFDQFSLSKIGTGEGAQAYGHGLYFAEKEGVAKSYRDALTDVDATARQYLNLWQGDRTKAAAAFERDIQSGAFGAAKPSTLTATHASILNPQGKMYEVNINADPDDFLDWDAPLSQQSEKVRGAFGQIPDMRGADAYLEQGFDTAESSQLLHKAGIPGIKYLDGASRSAGQGSRNYVVFDDRLISIVKKYGLVGAVGAGLISQEQGRQMKEAGY